MELEKISQIFFTSPRTHSTLPLALLPPEEELVLALENADPSLPLLLSLSFTAFPDPPLPTWYTGATSLSLSLSSSSSKRNIGRSSVLACRFPAPPRPVVNLWFDEECEEDCGVVVVRREVTVVVGGSGCGGRVALPAPPRPKVILGEAVGWGSERRMGIIVFRRGVGK